MIVSFACRAVANAEQTKGGDGPVKVRIAHNCFSGGSKTFYADLLLYRNKKYYSNVKKGYDLFVTAEMDIWSEGKQIVRGPCVAVTCTVVRR